MKRKRIYPLKSFYLPDECWEYIFKFIIDGDNNNGRYLYPLSVVSKQFLSIIDPLRFSLTVLDPTRPFLRSLFKRFTNLKSLDLSRYHGDLDVLLRKISRFPLKLTSLNLSNQPTIPANGLQAFSKKIKTLTSLTCSRLDCFNNTDFFLIVECFPLLEELDLSDHKSYSGFHVIEDLSLKLPKLRKVNLSMRIPINNHSFFLLLKNCKFLEEVILSSCNLLTNIGIASALRERPTLRSLSLSGYNRVFTASHLIDSLVSLKGLTCLHLQRFFISDKLFYSIAREGLPLTRLVLQYCAGHSYAGIFCLLSKCQRLQHLDLTSTQFLKDKHVINLSQFLGDLMSINLSCCDKLTKSALFILARNYPSLSEIKMISTKSKKIKYSRFSRYFGAHRQLKSLFLGDNQWLSDKDIVMFASIFPNLQLLDLNLCGCISESVCHFLRVCCKIRHLNLAGCSRVKLLGLNFVVPKLEVLNLSRTMVDDETLYVISKNCCGLLQLILEHCDDVTHKGLKHVVKNCKHLRELNLGDFHLDNRDRNLFSCHGCLLC